MYLYKAKVCSIYDGDTITCLVDLGFNIHIKEKFRLFGIDTPEIRTKDLNEKKEGFRAKKRLSDLIENKEIYIKVIKKGKFGRWISNIYLTEKDIELENSINNLLLKEGLAKPFMKD